LLIDARHGNGALAGAVIAAEAADAGAAVANTAAEFTM
jgi:hypothetical protein